MKRLSALLALVLTAALLLSACGGRSSGAASAPSSPSSAEVSAPTPVPTANPDGPQGRPVIPAAGAPAAISPLSAGAETVLASLPLRVEMLYGRLSTDASVDENQFPKTIEFDSEYFDGMLGSKFWVFGAILSSFPNMGEAVVEGDRLYLLPFSSYEYGEVGHMVNCAYRGDVIEFGLQAVPNGFILTRDGESVRYSFDELPALDNGWGVHYCCHPDYPVFEGLQELYKSPFQRDGADPQPGYVDSELRGDGVMHLEWLDAGLQRRSADLVYAVGRDLLQPTYVFFTDGRQLYCYVRSYIYDMIRLSSNLDPEQQLLLTDLSEDAVQQLAETRTELLDELCAAFDASGLAVKVDRDTGAVAVDSALLYATDAYEVTDEGKDFLREIFSLYCSILSQDKYRDFIAEIRVEGHTDTSGAHDYNQELSEKRAEAVRAFCLSEECGLEDLAWLEPLLTAVGYADDRPILAADGSVDMDASRRVELRFLIALP